MQRTALRLCIDRPAEIISPNHVSVRGQGDDVLVKLDKHRPGVLNRGGISPMGGNIGNSGGN